VDNEVILNVSRVAAALVADPTQSDRAVARECERRGMERASHGWVREVRAAMAADGLIADLPPHAAGRPRARKPMLPSDRARGALLAQVEAMESEIERLGAPVVLRRLLTEHRARLERDMDLVTTALKGAER